MALTECKECNGKVSDQALSCPHCGLPFKSATPPALPTHYCFKCKKNINAVVVSASRPVLAQTLDLPGDTDPIMILSRQVGKMVCPLCGSSDVTNELATDRPPERKSALITLLQWILWGLFVALILSPILGALGVFRALFGE